MWRRLPDFQFFRFRIFKDCVARHRGKPKLVSGYTGETKNLTSEPPDASVRVWRQTKHNLEETTVARALAPPPTSLRTWNSSLIAFSTVVMDTRARLRPRSKAFALRPDAGVAPTWWCHRRRRRRRNRRRRPPPAPITDRLFAPIMLWSHRSVYPAARPQ